LINLIINKLTISALKKYLSVFLLLFFLFNIGGHYLWFSILKSNIQKEIRREIRQGLSEKDLTLIAVPFNDESGICWIKPGKEFTYRGKMYDVVKTRISDSRKFYYCIDDIKEKKLIDDFSKKNEPSQKARKLLGNYHYIYVIQPESFFHINETSNHDYCIKSFDAASNIEEVTIPPPKFTFPA
jgi:hypothetical protein